MDNPIRNAVLDPHREEILCHIRTHGRKDTVPLLIEWGLAADEEMALKAMAGDYDCNMAQAAWQAHCNRAHAGFELLVALLQNLWEIRRLGFYGEGLSDTIWQVAEVLGFQDPQVVLDIPPGHESALRTQLHMGLGVDVRPAHMRK